MWLLKNWPTPTEWMKILSATKRKVSSMATTPEPEFTHADGTTRKSHYGSGRQPWDDIVAAGWGKHFAAGNVLKYLRRTKDREDSLKKAQWYYNEIKQRQHYGDWVSTMETLIVLLTPEERRQLDPDQSPLMKGG